ncbi:uncharacterized protein L201_005875 [Kwoniella dendrophila CBS 6074]|uniref:NmrA-like domain-containing protein n=1 Tax=Kwoniella dendrophila CBS 6074 TaxID=1295534 RepID=A0AAX4K076_9TREE
MVHTVGFYGHSGRTGVVVTPRLLKARDEGKINLVVLHRPSSDISKLPQDLEKRVLDLEKGSEDEIKAAVKGINVLLSNVAYFGLADQVKLIKPLSETPGFVTLIPSGYGPAWAQVTPANAKKANEPTYDQRLDLIKTPMVAVAQAAADAGVAVTNVECGLLADGFFQEEFLGTKLSKNEITLFKDALNKPIYLVTVEGLADALVDIVTREPLTIAGKVFHTNNFAPTGAEIIALSKEINGKSEVKINEFTQEEYDSMMAVPGHGMAIASWHESWCTDNWSWYGERVGEVVDVEEFAKTSVQ